jgi:hypothetical protein
MMKTKMHLQEEGKPRNTRTTRKPTTGDRVASLAAVARNVCAVPIITDDSPCETLVVARFGSFPRNRKRKRRAITNSLAYAF